MSVIALIFLMEKCKIIIKIDYQYILTWQILKCYSDQFGYKFREQRSAPLGIVGGDRSNLGGLNFPCGSYAETGLASSVIRDYRRAV